MNYRFSGYFYIAILISIAVLYTILSLVTPYYLDDWMFMGEYKEHAGTETFSREGFMNFFRYIRWYDNSRIANLLSPFSTLFYPFNIIFPYVNGCVYAIMICMVQRLSCGDNGRLKCLFLLISWASVIVFLPWFDSILVFDYTLNYVWSSAFSLLFIYFILKYEKINKWNGVRLIGVALLAVLAGGFHEGFGVPTSCGVVLAAFWKKGRMSWQYYFIGIILIASTLIFMLGDGIIHRISYTTEGERIFPGLRIVAVILITAGCYIMAFSLKKGRKAVLESMKSLLFPICIGIMISGYLIGFFTIGAPRCYFYPNLAVLVLLLNLTYRITGVYKRYFEVGYVSGIVGVILFAACCAQTIGVIYWQKFFGDKTKKIYAMMKTSPSGMIYYDLELFYPIPEYTLKMPVTVRNIWSTFFEFKVLNMYYQRPFLSLAPTFMEHMDISEGHSIAGNLYVRVVDDYYFTRREQFDEKITVPSLEIITIEKKDGNKKDMKLTVFPFITHPKGATAPDTLVYFRINEINREDIHSIDKR